MRLAIVFVILLLPSLSFATAATDETAIANAENLVNAAFVLANVFGFLLGGAWGWARAARPNVDLLQ